MATRWEHDFLGDMEIDDSLYYGIQTIRGMHASPLSGQSINVEAKEMIYYMAAIKQAAARANGEIGAISADIAEAIVKASEEVMEGKFDDQFPVDMFTGGGGITPHMNMNEVLANRASEILTGKKTYEAVHPNTHVNKCQSTNDVYPAAILLAIYDKMIHLINKTNKLAEVLEHKSEEFQDVVKIGRTCFQDAMPVTLGQEFSGYASFVRRQIRFLRMTAKECLTLPLGGTAVGTCSGCEPGYKEAVLKHLKQITGWDLELSDNYFDSFQNGDLYARISFAMKTLASGLSKMSQDFRVMSSGPRAGFSEIRLPEALPGSSIMPGKINPTLPELMNQVCFQICGNDVTITMAVEHCDLDLNVWEAIISKCLFESATVLTGSIELFAEKCVAGITANKEVCYKHAAESVSLSAVISSLFGYPVGSMVARKASEQNRTIAEVAVEEGLLTKEQADDLLDPLKLTDGDALAVRIHQFKAGRL